MAGTARRVRSIASVEAEGEAAEVVPREGVEIARREAVVVDRKCGLRVGGHVPPEAEAGRK